MPQRDPVWQAPAVPLPGARDLPWRRHHRYLIELCVAANASKVTLHIGVFTGIAEFTLDALACKHPFDVLACPPSGMAALPMRMPRSTQVIVDLQLAALRHWRQRAEQPLGRRPGFTR